MAGSFKKRKLNIILVILLPFLSSMVKLSIRNLKTPTFPVRRLCLAAKAESLGRWCPYLSQFYPCSVRLSFCPSASRYRNHNQIVLQGMRMPNRRWVSKDGERQQMRSQMSHEWSVADIYAQDWMKVLILTRGSSLNGLSTVTEGRNSY